MLNSNTPSPLNGMMNQEAMQSVVHDLRTPITVIKGNLQLLLSGLMGQMTDEQLLLLQRSIGPLEDVILLTENLLQSTNLESDLTLKLEESDLDKLLSDTINFYAVPFTQREMEIFRDGNTYGRKLRVDTFWMKRVLNNLIWNAYKFTPDHGRVVIRVEHGSGTGLNLVIEDNGRGIPADRIGNIFQKFAQAEPSKDMKMGTGLGLWICRRIMEMHEGSIRAESEEGKGTRFILSFPSSCVL